MSQILVRAAAGALLAAALAACGQKGTLMMPTGPGAAQRATLPQSLNPMPRPVPSTVDPTANALPAPAPPAPPASSPNTPAAEPRPARSTP